MTHTDPHSPYKFQSPWDAFEFGYHILHSESNLVIVSMAWNTLKEKDRFTSMPYEPDLETLAYWATRLEPVIRAEDDEEVIVVFANRCGVEDDIVYAGTSAVIGIKGGEVSVYGLLGRGEKELLVVDTEKPAFAKMVLSQGQVESDSPTQVSAANAAADASIASMLGLPAASTPSPPSPQLSNGIPEETAEEVTKASSPAPRASSPAPSVSSEPKKSRPSPPKLTIPQKNGSWRRDDSATHHSGDAMSLANSAPPAQSEGALADWLVGQAKTTASHPKPSKLNPDSGIDVSPGSFLGVGLPSSIRNRSQSPSKSVASTSRRHRRNLSRTSDSRFTTRSGRSSRRAPSVSVDGDEYRAERRELRRLANFKDSPRVERPDEVILDKFLKALAQATHDAAEDLMEEHSISRDNIKTSTISIPEDIMIGASPSVLETSFPPIPPLPQHLQRQRAPDLSPMTVAEIQAMTPSTTHLPWHELSEWQSLHSGLGTLAEEKGERSSYAPSVGGGGECRGVAEVERDSMTSHDGRIPFQLDVESERMLLSI
jgi:hypothetical protein